MSSVLMGFQDEITSILWRIKWTMFGPVGICTLPSNVLGSVGLFKNDILQFVMVISNMTMETMSRTKHGDLLG